MRHVLALTNATMADVGRPKVEVLSDFVGRLGLGTRVEAFYGDLAERAASRAVSTCDVAFGCMDGIDGRDLLNRLATFYGLAYFDVGVMLDADGEGGVDQICGSVHYLQPGRSSLRGRGLYTDAMLEADGLRRQDPVAYADRLACGYIRGVAEDRPAVGAVNGLFSSLAVLELLLRVNPSRLDAGRPRAPRPTRPFRPGRPRQPGLWRFERAAVALRGPRPAA